jgi:hypothetical protein
MDFTEFAYRLHPAVIEQARASLGELERPPVAMMRALDLRRALIRELPTR